MIWAPATSIFSPSSRARRPHFFDWSYKLIGKRGSFELPATQPRRPRLHALGALVRTIASKRRADMQYVGFVEAGGTVPVKLNRPRWTIQLQ